MTLVSLELEEQKQSSAWAFCLCPTSNYGLFFFFLSSHCQYSGIFLCRTGVKKQPQQQFQRGRNFSKKMYCSGGTLPLKMGVPWSAGSMHCEGLGWGRTVMNRKANVTFLLTFKTTEVSSQALTSLLYVVHKHRIRKQPAFHRSNQIQVKHVQASKRPEPWVNWFRLQIFTCVVQLGQFELFHFVK